MSTSSWGGPVSPEQTTHPQTPKTKTVYNSRTPFLMLLAQGGAWEPLPNGLVWDSPGCAPPRGGWGLQRPTGELARGRKCPGPVLLGTRLHGPWCRADRPQH